MTDDKLGLQWEGRVASVEKWTRDQLDHAATHYGVTREQVTSSMLRALHTTPDRVGHPSGGNLLLVVGLNALLHLAFDTFTKYDTAHGYLGVGDGTTAALNTQTALQGAHTAWAAFNAANPVIAAGTTVTTATIAADFASGVAEGWTAGWQEWAIGNGSSGGTLLNRAVDSTLGTGKNTELWTLNAIITLGT